MKLQRFSLLSSIILTGLVLSPAGGQSTANGGSQSPSQPPAKASIDTYYLLGRDGQLTELLSVSAALNTKGKLGGLAGVKQSVEIPGEKAALRIKAGEMLFVVGTAGQLPDRLPPIAYARLDKLDVKGGKRVWIFQDITSYGGFGGKANNNGVQSAGIPLNFARYDEHAIKIDPRSPLPPGEYAFVVNAHDPYQTLLYKFFSFGVD